MLRYIYAEDMGGFPTLNRSMFEDRADQFKTRLGWAVNVDTNGQERDDYDAMNPLYVIWQRSNGCHGGSMRVMPTTGSTMVNDHFAHVAGLEIISPFIWESTRFCLSRELSRENAARASAALMLGGCEIGLRFGLQHAIGVFDARMIRIYRMLGWSPEVLGESGEGRNKVYVGLWDFSEEVRSTLAPKAGIAPSLSEMWFEASFGKRGFAEAVA